MWKKLVFMGVLGLVFAGGIYLAYILSDNPGESAKNFDSLNSGLTEEMKTKVEAYIREHVSEFSPEKEVLGGKFYITKITFISLEFPGGGGIRRWTQCLCRERGVLCGFQRHHTDSELADREEELRRLISFLESVQ